jgi:hypothetical protein
LGAIPQLKPQQTIDFRSSHIAFAGKQFRGCQRKKRFHGDQVSIFFSYYILRSCKLMKKHKIKLRLKIGMKTKINKTTRLNPMKKSMMKVWRMKNQNTKSWKLKKNKLQKINLKESKTKKAKS